MIPSSLQDKCEGKAEIYLSIYGTCVKKISTALFITVFSVPRTGWHITSAWQFLSDGSIWKSRTHSVSLRASGSLNCYGSVPFYLFTVLLTILQIPSHWLLAFFSKSLFSWKMPHWQPFKHKSCPLSVLGARVAFAEVMHFPGLPSCFNPSLLKRGSHSVPAPIYLLRGWQTGWFPQNT